jgi:hypothetical protein
MHFLLPPKCPEHFNLLDFTIVKIIIQGASRETDVFEMNITEQVEGVEA